MEYLRRAVEVAPDNYKFKVQLGSAYMKKKDFVNALPIFEDLVKSYPDEAAYHQNLGLILSQMPDRKARGARRAREDARAQGERSVRQRHSRSRVQRARPVPEGDRRGEARPRGEDRRQEPLLYYQWGVALSKLESYDEAIAMFEKVVATKDPQWIDAAKKQIDRQVRLKKIAEQKKQQE